MARIFISHSSRDNAEAGHIKQWLTEQGFERAFLDFDKHSGLTVGDDWERRLYQEIERSHAVVIVSTPNWHASKWCWSEFTQARALGKPIFPILVAPSDERFVAGDIQQLDLIDDAEGGLAQLARRLTEIALDAQSGFDWDASRPPYPGMLAFEEEDAAIFFGRDDDIRRVIEKANARRAQGGPRLLALLGASGSGKSSLMKAGVIPRLKRDTANWLVLPVFRPRSHPLGELSRVIASACSGVDWRDVRNELTGDRADDALLDRLNDIAVTGGRSGAQILLPIDQGEELFSASDGRQAAMVFSLLNSALSSDDGALMALMTIRSDFLGMLQRPDPLTARFAEISLGPLPLERVAQVIEGPGRVAGIKVESGLVLKATKDAATEDALPLLALAMRRLHDGPSSTGGTALTLTAYEALGDPAQGRTPLDNVVRDVADEVMRTVQPDVGELEALRKAFIPKLVSLNEDGTEFVRTPALWTEMPEIARPLLEKFVAARLLVSRPNDDETRTIEIAHEALLRQWPLLRDWLEEERDFLIWQQSHSRAVEEWKRAPFRDQPDFLLTGRKLTDAIEWQKSHDDDLTRHERLLISDSVERERNKRTRTNVLVALAIAGLSLFAVGLSIAFYNAREAEKETGAALVRVEEEKKKAERALGEAETAKGVAEERQRAADLARIKAEDARIETLTTESRVLAFTASELNNQGRHSDAMALARAALPKDIRKPDRPFIRSAYQALIDSWRDIREEVVFRGHEKPILGAIFSPDEKHVLTWAGDGTMRLWGRDGKPVWEANAFPAKNWANAMGARFLDDRTIASWGTDGALRTWNAQSGKLLKVIVEPLPELVYNVSRRAGFSAENRFVAVRSEDRTRVIDLLEKVPEVVLPPSVLEFEDSSGNSAPVIIYRQEPPGAPHAQFEDLWVYNPYASRLVQLMYSPDIYSLEQSHANLIENLRFSSDGMHVLGYVSAYAFDSNDPRKFIVWNRTTGKQALFWSIPAERQSYDSGASIMHDAAGRIVFWTLNQGAQLLRVDDPSRSIPLEGHEPTTIVSSSGGGTDRAAWTTTRRTIVGVIGATFTKDGSRIATWAQDRSIRLWDADTGRLLFSLRGHTDDIGGAKFTRDGRRLISWSDDMTVQIWDARNGRRLGVLVSHEHVTQDGDAAKAWGFGARFSGNEREILSWSGDGTARLWHAEPRKNFELYDAGHDIDRAEFTGDGRHVVTWRRVDSKSNEILIHDAVTGTRVGVFARHKVPVRNVLIHPDGTSALSLDQDGYVYRWNVATGQVVGEFSVPHLAWEIALDRTGEMLWIWLTYRSRKPWRAEDVDEFVPWPDNDIGFGALRTVRLADASILSESELADGTLVHTAFSSKANSYLRVTPENKVVVIRPDRTTSVSLPIEATDTVHDLRLAQNGMIANVRTRNGVIIALDVRDGTVMAQRTIGELASAADEYDWFTAPTFNTYDGFHLVVAERDQQTRVYNLRAATGSRTLPRSAIPSGSIRSKFSPDGQTVLLYASYHDEIRGWNVSSGRQLFAVRAHRTTAGATSTVSDVNVSRDGKWFVSWASEPRARVWNASTGEAIATFSHKEIFINEASFSPDGKRVLVRGGDATRLWPFELNDVVQMTDRKLAKIKPLSHLERCDFFGGTGDKCGHIGRASSQQSEANE